MYLFIDSLSDPFKPNEQNITVCEQFKNIFSIFVVRNFCAIRTAMAILVLEKCFIWIFIWVS